MGELIPAKPDGNTVLTLQQRHRVLQQDFDVLHPLRHAGHNGDGGLKLGRLLYAELRPSRLVDSFRPSRLVDSFRPSRLVDSFRLAILRDQRSLSVDGAILAVASSHPLAIRQPL